MSDLTPETLQAILETRLKGLEDSVKEGFTQRDKAIMLLQAFADKQPTTESVKQDVDHLKEFFADKFVQNDKSVKDAFAAAKEAIAEQNKSNTAASEKSEHSFTKQVEAMDGKINDVKERVIALETAARTVDKGTDNSVRTINLVIAGAVAVVVILTAIVSVIAFLISHEAAGH